MPKSRTIDPGPDHHDHWHFAEWVKAVAPFLILAAIVVAILWPLIKPAPPRKVVIATGPEGSSYNDFAAAYAKVFARHGITLEIRPSGGSKQNYDLLMDEKSGVDLAIVQGGTAPPREQAPNIEAVASVSFEPLFILYRRAQNEPPITKLGQLKGKRLAVGKPEGGTYWLAMPMLRLHGIGTPDDNDTKIVISSGSQSIAKLKAGEVDAGFYAVSADTRYIRDTLALPGYDVVSLAQAGAYQMHFNYVTTATLSEGGIDITRNLPAHDVKLVAPVTTVVARKNTHNAILRVLVQAVQEVHSKRDPLAPGQFPSLDYTELPVGSDARYFFTNKPNWLHRTLPFWLASLIDRLLILLVPLLVILIPLVRLAPRIYQWRMRARVYKWYKRIRALDAQLVGDDAALRDKARDQAQQLEKEIADACKVPLGYMEHFYHLRLHLAYIRDRLSQPKV